MVDSASLGHDLVTKEIAVRTTLREVLIGQLAGFDNGLTSGFHLLLRWSFLVLQQFLFEGVCQLMVLLVVADMPGNSPLSCEH